MATAEREVAVVEAPEEEGGNVLPVLSRAAAPPRRELVGGLLRPVAAPAEVLQAQNDTRALITEALQGGRDFGVIPGTDKPSLLKPGAERILGAFGCAVEAEILEKEVDHDREVKWVKVKWVTVGPKPDNWGELKAQGLGRNRQFDGQWKWQERQEENGTSLGLYRYVVRVNIIHRASGAIIGTGLGSCSTLESKYIDRPRDAENTVLKMAKKRAQIDGVLTTFGLSDQFTQDIEDNPEAFGLGGEGDGTAKAAGGNPPASAPSNKPEAQRPKQGQAHGPGTATHGESGSSRSTAGTTSGATEAEARCPKCGGKMWDNREGKKNPKAPDFKCRDKGCDGVYWPGEWPPQEPEHGELFERVPADVIAEMEKLVGEVEAVAEPRDQEHVTWARSFLDQAKGGQIDEQQARAAMRPVQTWLEKRRARRAQEVARDAATPGKQNTVRQGRAVPTPFSDDDDELPF
jgi:hypothetical protein